jgi:CheY-like chemotaxis protein
MNSTQEMNSKQGRILWVDDDRFMARAFAHLLNSLGYSNFVLVTGESAGQDAVNIVRTEPFDIIITDRRMPTVDGFSVAEAVRQVDAELGRPQTPMLMVTIRDVMKRVSKENNQPVLDWLNSSGEMWEVEVRQRAEELSINLLVKPIGKDRLHDALRTYMSSQTSRSKPLISRSPFVDPNRMRCFLKAFFEQLEHENSFSGGVAVAGTSMNQLEMTPRPCHREEMRFSFWTWYDEPHRAEERLRNTRYTKSELNQPTPEKAQATSKKPL